MAGEADGAAFAGAFEAAKVGLGLVGADGRFVAVNAALSEIVALDGEVLVGASPTVLSDDDTFRTQCEALATARRVEFEVEVPRSAVDPGGSWLRISSSRLRGNDDVRAAAVYVVEDVTARIQVEAALAATRSELETRATELERSNADLARFAAVASHDLSEPLRMVTSYVQLIARRLELTDDDELAVYVGFAVDGAQRMRVLIDDVLRYAEAGRAEDAHAVVDLNDVVGDVVVDLSEAVTESGATIAVDVLPTVRGNRRELAQVFTNLLTNALKFRLPDEAPRVQITAEESGVGWRLTVRDEGIGIDEAQRERVFAMFQRLHSRAAYPGTGIGLALCRRIVESHGGQIWIEDGAGTAVSFTLRAAS